MPKDLSLEDLTKAELIIFIRENPCLNLISQVDLLHARWSHLSEKSMQLEKQGMEERRKASESEDPEAFLKSFKRAEQAHNMWKRAEKIYAQMELLRSN